ncbi:MAG: helix-turn-helix domain-containing protein [Gemmatimonadaceae bacterium]|nr:helix-turn-helix domain-containing protein [Gemmatimonadaceae bacterium]
MTSEEARRTRRRAKLTQAQVAAALKISTFSYRRWEAGQVPLPYERTILDVFEAIDTLKAHDQ